MSKASKSPNALSDQQERFCHEYLKDLKGTKAAIRAGYSEKSAHVAASRLLSNDKIADRCKELNDARTKRIDVSADKVLEELDRISTSDLVHAFADNNTLLPLKEMPEAIRRAIASIEVDEIFEGTGENRTWIGYTKKVKLWPKDRGLELTGKHLKLFTDKIEHTGKFTLEDLVAGKNEDKEK